MQMRRLVFVITIGLPLVFAGRTVRGADPDLFGAIAILDDDAVADKLGLSKETRANLAALIDKRLNDPDLVELAATKNLPAEERAAKWKKFREESEQMGLKLLTEEQQKKLQQVRLEKSGLLALADPEVAKQLGLSDEQKTQIAGLVSKRETQVASASATNRNTIISYYATKFAEVLTDEQRAKWEQMGGQVPTTQPSKASDAPSDSQGGANGASRGFGRNDNGRGRGGFGGGFGNGGRNDSRVSAGGTSSELTAAGDNKMVFKFKNARWPDVIQLFAERAGYSLVMESPPQRTFNYEDNAPKTPQEGLDILNQMLLQQDFLLVPSGPGGKLLFLIDLKNPINSNLVQPVAVEELDPKNPKYFNHGQYDLAQATFTINKLSMTDAEALIKKLLTYQGAFQGNLMSLPQAKQIMVTDTVGRLRTVKQVLDRADSGDADTDLSEKPRFEVYQITVADPDMVLKVVQTMLAGSSDVRLSVDTKTGYLIAQARPSQLTSIRTLVNKLEGRDATQSNDATIQFVPLAGRAQQEELLLKAQALWRLTRPNAIRVITPSASEDSPGGRFAVPPGGMIDERHSQPTSAPDPSSLRVPPAERSKKPAAPAPQNTPASSSGMIPTEPSRIQSYPIDSSTSVSRSHFHLVSSEIEKNDSPGAQQETATALVNSDVRTSPADATAGEKTKSAESTQGEKIDVKPGDGSASKSQIVVVPGPGGLIIASEDPNVLNDFKALLAKVQSPQGTKGQKQFTVFYLRHARAADAAAVLSHIFGASSSSSGSNSITNNIADRAMSNFGGPFGSLLAMAGGGGGDAGDSIAAFSGGRGASGGSIDYLAEPRLNALIVQATPADIDTIEQLLKVIDQPDSPEEVSITPKPRMIYVENCEADDVATTVKSVYANRLEAAAGQQQQFGPADFIQAVAGRGGRGGRGGRSGGGDSEPAKMTVSVDKRNNALVVAAPDSLFYEVKALVQQIDQPFTEPHEKTVIVSLQKGSSPSAIKTALMAVLGDQARTTTGTEMQPTTGAAAGLRGLASATTQGAGQGLGNAFGGNNGGFGNGGFNRGGGGNAGGGFGNGGGGFNRGGGGGGFGNGGGGGFGNGGGGGGGFNRGGGGGGFGGGGQGGGFGGGGGGRGGFGGGGGGGGRGGRGGGGAQ
jgi:type II secretory pathway component GspD/PulD (secretin)